MKKWIYLVGVLVLLASCVNEIMDEEVLNKQVNDSATRAGLLHRNCDVR